MGDYIDHTELGFLAQLKHFKETAPDYAAKFGLTTDDLDETVEDWEYLDYIITCRHITEAYFHALTEYRNLALHGSKTAKLGPLPPPPVFPAAPTLVEEDIILRFQQKANAIKASKKYTEADGKALGIVAGASVIDYSKAKPDPKLDLNGGFVEISWHFNTLKAVNVYKNTGGAGYGTKPYKTLHHSPFTDRSPLPDQSETRLDSYKMVYVHQDQEVGFFSDEVRIAVTGLG